MRLGDYQEQYSSKMNYLQDLFIKDIFYKDYGELGLDKIVPEVELERDDGTDRVYRIDFVVKTSNKKYAIELHGFHAHDESGRYVDEKRFNELQKKNNLKL